MICWIHIWIVKRVEVDRVTLAKVFLNLSYSQLLSKIMFFYLSIVNILFIFVFCNFCQDYDRVREAYQEPSGHNTSSKLSCAESFSLPWPFSQVHFELDGNNQQHWSHWKLVPAFPFPRENFQVWCYFYFYNWNCWWLLTIFLLLPLYLVLGVNKRTRLLPLFCALSLM